MKVRMASEPLFAKMWEMSTLELNVYETLKSKFGEKEAKQFLEFLDAKTEKRVES